MNRIQQLAKEMEKEAVTTRKMLERVPQDKFDWKPHEKSMSLLQLASHVAEIPGWTGLILDTKELDFARGDYQAPTISDVEGLKACHEKNLASSVDRLGRATEEEMADTWTMRSGDTIFACEPKDEMIRGAFCQTVHHRAQLGVYLRLLNIPIPGSYGPSADEPSFS